MSRAGFSGTFALAILLGACFAVGGQTAEQQSTPSPTPAATASASPGDSTGLVVISAPKPYYPMEARERGLQGKVWIHLLISETGDVESADIISGHPDLARAALEAMKKWKFKPYIRNGKPVKVSTKMPFDFAFQNQVTDAKVSPDSSAKSSGPPNTAGASRNGSPGNLPVKLRVSAAVAEGFKVHDVTPVYPPEARMNHVQGEVLLQATIGTDGLIHDLKVIEGHPVLVEAAKGAVEQWRYKPYLLNGNPVEVETTIKVTFHMR
jgi:TonB family protein